MAHTASQQEDKRGPLRVTPSFFIRDIVFLIITTSYLLFVLLVIKSITLWVSLGFILIYAIYVIQVMVQSNQEQEDDESQNLNVQASVFTHIAAGKFKLKKRDI